ncbi:MAG TPA: hypothetical protein VFN23_21105 [Ktedonobacteraceae bacterium]|nr:hypothetical protein [Ktedonobacteraceae bacterium]
MRYYVQDPRKIDLEHKERQQEVNRFPFWLLVLIPVLLLCLMALISH